MKRVLACALFFCSILPLTSCGAGKAETVATVQAALAQADALDSVAVTIVTTTTVTAETGAESTSKSTRTCWRKGNDTIQQFEMPILDGGNQDEVPTVFATIDGTSYRKAGTEWQAADALDFSWTPLSDVPSDAEQYTIEQDGDAFTIKLTSEALSQQLQKDIEEAKALADKMTAEGREAEANAQFILIENLEKSRIRQHDITVSVNNSQTATGCTSHLIFEGYSIEQTPTGALVSGAALTTDLTVEWKITSTDKEDISAKMAEYWDK